MTMQPDAVRDAIERMGDALGPQKLAAVQALYRDEQRAAAVDAGPVMADAAYGPDPRHRLDLYAPAGAKGPVPVLLWVHGGGFVRGDKHADDHPYNAHVGRWAARSGMLGAVMNYRLAPVHGWPAGGEDVGAAIDWLRANAGRHGGDPDRIVAIGTSAGAVHVATHLHLRPDDPGVRGAVLLSGLYGFAPFDERDRAYFGPPGLHADRAPRAAVVATALPLLVACAQFDPPRFQAETLGVLAARLDAHGRMPQATILSGHNHFSMACHIGTADTRLADEIRAFAGVVAGMRQQGEAP